MSFEKGDRLEILDRPPADPEWSDTFFFIITFFFVDNSYKFQNCSFRFKARNGMGQVGLVPRNYLQELSDYLSQPYR